MTVTDNDGASAQATRTITVEEPAPDLPQLPELNLSLSDLSPEVDDEVDIELEVIADTDDQVMSVRFYVDNDFVKEDSTEPYSYQWEPTEVGEYQVLALVELEDLDDIELEVSVVVEEKQSTGGGGGSASPVGNGSNDNDDEGNEDNEQTEVPTPVIKLNQDQRQSIERVERILTLFKSILSDQATINRIEGILVKLQWLLEL